MSCIFCDIIERKAQAEIIYEDDSVISFLDIRPVNYGHALVIPKNHYKDFLSVPAEEMNKVIKVSQIIAEAVSNSLSTDGFNIVANNGTAAGQSVFHFHFHIIPRFNNDFTIKPKFKTYSSDVMREFGDQIRSFISKYKDIFNG